MFACVRGKTTSGPVSMKPMPLVQSAVYALALALLPLPRLPKAALHLLGTLSRACAMAENAAAAAPDAMECCDTSTTKKWAGAMGGRTEYS